MRLQFAFDLVMRDHIAMWRFTNPDKGCPDEPRVITLGGYMRTGKQRRLASCVRRCRNDHTSVQRVNINSALTPAVAIRRFTNPDKADKGCPDEPKGNHPRRSEKRLRKCTSTNTILRVATS